MVKANISISDIPEYALKEILEFEKETLGFYVSGHPLDSYRDELAKINYTLSSELEDLADGSDTMIIGRVEEIKTKISKKITANLRYSRLWICTALWSLWCLTIT